MTIPAVEGLCCTLDHGVARIQIVRPNKKNAFSEEMWYGLSDMIRFVSTHDEVRVVLIEGDDAVFSSGMDTAFLMRLGESLSRASDDEARKRFHVLQLIEHLQGTSKMLASCPHPVIAAVNGLAMGAAMDLLSVCDIRLCSPTAAFSVKEIDWTIPADLGVLYYLPRIMSPSIAHEWIFTGRTVSAEEASSAGFCRMVSGDAVDLLQQAHMLATEIAHKSPLAIRGIKRHLRYNITASLSDSLAHIAQWNAAFLSEQDIKTAGFAFLQGKKPSFKNI